MEQQNLQQFIQSSSQYVGKDDFVDGTFKGQYKGYSVYAKSFKGQTKQCVGYKFYLPELGVEKVLESTSVRLARLMASFQDGDTLLVHKEGDAFETTWEVKKADASSNTAPTSDFETSLKNTGFTESNDEPKTIEIPEEEPINVENIPF